MTEDRRNDERGAGFDRGDADRGATFIELLVSIVLIGTVVIAVVVAVQVSAAASKTDAEHARANAYLHDASDAVYEAARISCTSGLLAVTSAYQTAVDAVTPPQGWSGVTVDVTEVEFLVSPDPNANTFTWGPDCREGNTPAGDYTDNPLLSQKVTLRVTSPDGGFTKSLETVKADP